MHLFRLLSVATVAAGMAVSPAGQRFGHYEVDERVANELMEFTRSLDHLEKRISEDFSLDKQWNNDNLFNGNIIVPGTPTKVTNLNLKCIECYTKGKVTAKLTTKKLIKPIVRFDLAGVEAYMKLGVTTTGVLAFSVNLYSSNTPIGLSVRGLKLGIIFSVDLAFTVSSAMDLEGGFYMKLAEDAFFEVDILDGDIMKNMFDGTGFQTIPVTIHSGPVTFKADLRLRLDMGAQVGFGKFGVGAMVGVFANLVEFVAQIEKTDTCLLQAKEFFDLNIGASASAGIGNGAKTFAVVPAVSTTLLNSPTFTQCLIDMPPVFTSAPPAITTTAVTTQSVPSLPPSTEPAPQTSTSGPATQTSSFESSSQVSTTMITTQDSSISTSSGTSMSTPATSNAATSTSAGAVSTSSSSSAAYQTSTNAISSMVTTTKPPVSTSTKCVTKLYTVTACNDSVVNCPASQANILVVTQTLTAKTGSPAQATSAPEIKALNFKPKAMTELIILSKMKSPVTATYKAPVATPIAESQIKAIAGPGCRAPRRVQMA